MLTSGSSGYTVVGSKLFLSIVGWVVLTDDNAANPAMPILCNGPPRQVRSGCVDINSKEKRCQ